jgi:hypothetical protein
MTADPGSEAGAAGIEPVYYYECQERAMAPGIGDGWPRVIAAPHTKNARLIRREGAPHEWKAEAAAATARAEKAEAEVARLRAALEDATQGLYCECHDLGPKGDPDCHACNALKALGVIPAERNTDPAMCQIETLGYWCAPRACPVCDKQWRARGDIAEPARLEGET